MEEETHKVMFPNLGEAKFRRACVALLLIVSISVQMVQQTDATATEFAINNTALALNTSGGVRFKVDLGDTYILTVLQDAKDFIVKAFNLSEEKPVALLTLYIENITGVAYTIPGETVAETHLSAIYVEDYAPGNSDALKYEITGVLYHESVHVWQNFNGSYGVDPQFTGVIEGIADYIRLTAQYPANHWVRQAGGTWYDGYSTTAYFLQWIDETRVSGFVNKLNLKMADQWTTSFFEEITGQTVDQLWQAYQMSFSAVPRPTTTFQINNTALAMNTSGGIRFEVDLGDNYTLTALQNAKDFIVESFNLSQEKSVPLLTLYVDNITGVAYTGQGETGAETHLSAIYVEDYAPGNPDALKYEITGVLFHESTHVWQNGNGSYGVDPQFTGVIEGIADYIRLTAQYPANHWVRQAGGTWYDGYSTTAYFLQWIDETQVSGFVNKLNLKMAAQWNTSFFEDITGQNVDQLWQTYQNYISTNPPSVI